MKARIAFAVLLSTLLLGMLTWSTAARAAENKASEDLLRGITLLRPHPAGASGQVATAVSPIASAPHVYKFVTVDFPGAAFTEATGTGGGTTAGLLQFNPPSSSEPSFVYRNGTYSIFNVAGASVTILFGANDQAQIFGAYANTSGTVAHGFVDTAGTITNIDFPGSKITIVTAVNASGDSSGIWEDAANAIHGFVDIGGTFTSLDFPGGTNTQAAGLNDAGEVVGIYTDGAMVQHGFTWSGGTFTTLDVPLATTTTAFGINNAGVISGSYTDAVGNHGFLYSAGVFTKVDVIGATDTELTHVNNKGVFSGIFIDQLKETHGMTGH